MRGKTGIIITVIIIGLCSYEQCHAVDLMVGGLRLRKEVRCVKEIKNKYVVKQSLDYTCGPASLATILNYYFNDRISEKNIIASLLKTTSLAKVKSRNGFSLFDLKKFLQARGYEATGYQMDVDFLKELGLPVLVPIKVKNYRHFVVVRAVLGDRVFIADPRLGNMTMKICHFNRIWQDGIGLVIERGKDNVRDPFCSELAPLRVIEEDVMMVDYRRIKRIFESGVIRTAVFPSEF